jgi:hypothetical protein
MTEYDVSHYLLDRENIHDTVVKLVRSASPLPLRFMYQAMTY